MPLGSGRHDGNVVDGEFTQKASMNYGDASALLVPRSEKRFGVYDRREIAVFPDLRIEFALIDKSRPHGYALADAKPGNLFLHLPFDLHADSPLALDLHDEIRFRRLHKEVDLSRPGRSEPMPHGDTGQWKSPEPDPIPTAHRTRGDGKPFQRQGFYQNSPRRVKSQRAQIVDFRQSVPHCMTERSRVFCLRFRQRTKKIVPSVGRIGSRMIASKPK